MAGRFPMSKDSFGHRSLHISFIWSKLLSTATEPSLCLFMSLSLGMLYRFSVGYMTPKGLDPGAKTSAIC